MSAVQLAVANVPQPSGTQDEATVAQAFDEKLMMQFVTAWQVKVVCPVGTEAQPRYSSALLARVVPRIGRQRLLSWHSDSVNT